MFFDSHSAKDMNETSPSSDLPPPVSAWKKPALMIAASILGCCALTAVGTAWWVKHHFYASALKPVHLSAQEQQAFEQKLETLERVGETEVGGVEPAAVKDPREIALSAKEINAFLAAQGVGERIKVDLSRDRVSANFILPMDEELPLIGGTTLRLKLALGALVDAAGKLVLKIDDVSVGGVPLPNAWLGGVKGLDLIASNLDSDPVIRGFVAGIKDFEVSQGSVRLRLNE